jgi:hypothetical protein
MLRRNKLPRACPDRAIPVARRLVGLGLVLVVVLLSSALLGTGGAAAAADRPTLFVFLQTDAKATVFEKTLQQKLPALSVTVFGRFRDFEEALSARRPDAVLVLHPLLVSKGLTVTLRGVQRGEDAERYVLVSAGAPLAGSLSNRLIGAVDVLGRKETHGLVAGLLKAPDVRTKLVTKLEDLLSLLQFSAADAVLLPGGAVKAFTERSRLSLHVRDLPDARVGRASLAVLSAGVSAVVVQQIQGLDRATNEMMGVDGWRGK